MTRRPTVDQFPSFAETRQFLEEGKRQCIWYLPARERLCLVALPEEDESKALLLANEIQGQDEMQKSNGESLVRIAESCCCARHHRNHLYGSGLSQDLAKRWLKEIIPASKAATPDVKVEWNTPFAPTSGSAFAGHQVHESESIFSQICSSIDTRERTTGSIYIYTHDDNAVFAGMVKIGYTTVGIEDRLRSWGECGYGYPKLLGRLDAVRHPKRVELLTHFELVSCWHALRWCKKHLKQHIEWFKVEFATAFAIAQLWSQWIESAEPYDRRGNLQSEWKGHVEFLQEHEVPITGKAMVEIHNIELGLVNVDEFVDDDLLRGKTKTVKVKAEVEAVGLSSIPRLVCAAPA